MYMYLIRTFLKKNLFIYTTVKTYRNMQQNNQDSSHRKFKIIIISFRILLQYIYKGTFKIQFYILHVLW